MPKVKVAIELISPDDRTTMKWEQVGSAEGMDAFMLLGRAFELAQRDTAAPFNEALRAFFKGASIQKGDVADALSHIADQ